MLAERLGSFPRSKLLKGPTPLENLAQLSAMLRRDIYVSISLPAMQIQNQPGTQRSSYSPHAKADLLDGLNKGKPHGRGPILFVHTGGAPALFAYHPASA